VQARGIASVLGGIVGGENVLQPPLPDEYKVDGVEPKVVVSPGSIQAAAEVLGAAHREGWAVIPRGGGTAMGLGNIPSRAEVVLSTLHLRAPVLHYPADLTATAQAGTPIAHLQQQLGKKGQFLAVDPPHSAHATLGGIVAANTFGPNRQGYGTLRDHVLGVTVIQPDGTITHGGGRVVKNAAGYDMTKLYIGSLGSLGVIAEVNIRLRPCPESRRSVMGFFADAAGAYKAFASIFRSELIPTAFSLLNPSAVNALEDRAGEEPSDNQYCLIVGCEETPAAVDREIAQIGRLLREHKGERVREVNGQTEVHLWEAVRHLPFGRQASGDGKGPETLLCRVSVPTSSLAGMMESAESLGAGKALACLLSSYPGAGVLYCCFRPQTETTLNPAVYADVVRQLGELARDRGGHVVVERAPLKVKQQLDVWGTPSGAFPVMKALKEQFDPKGILNPGRFVGRL